MKIIEYLNDYYGLEAEDVDEALHDITQTHGDYQLPNHNYNFLKFVEREECS